MAGPKLQSSKGNGRAAAIRGEPALDVLEWLALVQLHRSAGGSVLRPNDPAILAAAEVLARLAATRGSARQGAQLRSPAGLVRRLSAVRRMERGDTSRIPRQAFSARRRFEEDPTSAEELATSVLRGDSGTPSAPTGETAGVGGATPSRGPVPFAGTALVERPDGPEALYMMVLEGAPPPTEQDPALRYVKIGRSQDARRREGELNLGFPPGMGMRWQLHHEIGLESGGAAHSLEQAVLAAIAEKGLSIGGEFCTGLPAHPGGTGRKAHVPT